MEDHSLHGIRLAEALERGVVDEQPSRRGNGGEERVDLLHPRQGLHLRNRNDHWRVTAARPLRRSWSMGVVHVRARNLQVGEAAEKLLAVLRVVVGGTEEDNEKIQDVRREICVCSLLWQTEMLEAEGAEFSLTDRRERAGAWSAMLVAEEAEFRQGIQASENVPVEVAEEGLRVTVRAQEVLREVFCRDLFEVLGDETRRDFLIALLDQDNYCRLLIR